MSLKNVYTVGLRNVGSYQVSGAPFVSGGINTAITDGVRVAFPYVTRWVKIINETQGLGTHVGFSQRSVVGSGKREFFIVQGDRGTEPLELKLTEIWFSGSCTSVTVLAGLTNIPTRQIDNVGVSPGPNRRNFATGSAGNSLRNWSGSIGVG